MGISAPVGSVCSIWVYTSVVFFWQIFTELWFYKTSNTADIKKIESSYLKLGRMKTKAKEGSDIVIGVTLNYIIQVNKGGPTDILQIN